MNDHLISDVTDGVQTIRFDRFEAENALTAAMCEAAADAISFGESSSRVRAIVITGSPGIFTIGLDPSDLATFAEHGAMGGAAIRLTKTLATVDKPVVAAVDGPVFGLGTTMLLLCDYVVASEWSSFAAPFADLGTAPNAGSSLLAPRTFGYQRAFALLVMGETFDARRAYTAGLISRVVAAEDVENASHQVAARIVSKPQEAIRLARRLMRGERRDLLQQIDQETAAFADLLRSTAARDALQAFTDRRR